jgi:hypothetical protein
VLRVDFRSTRRLAPSIQFGNNSPENVAGLLKKEAGSTDNSGCDFWLQSVIT